MSNKVKAYVYIAGYISLLLLLKDSIYFEWLDSQDTFVSLLFMFGPLLPPLYWMRNEPTTSAKNVGILAAIGFIAGRLLGKKID